MKQNKFNYLSVILLFLGIALGQSALAQTTWTIEPTASGNTITYKVKRSGNISQAVTVRYRTVGLSSYEGENFTAANGTLTFPAGINEKNVTVTAQTPSTEAYKYYQSGATRKYLFEVTDMGGFSLVSKEDNAGAGTAFNTSYLNQSVTDLVYFNSNGAIKSGDGNKYVDASYSSSSWVQVTDGGYSQAVHTISTDNLYSNNSTAASFRSYLNEIGYNMYATVYFTQMEEKDGYQYIQILADNSNTYDGNDPNGAVNAPSTSLYKACFILSYDPSGSVMSDPHYQFFPHRYNYVDRAAEQTAGISHYEFDYDNSHLYQQRFKATSYQSNTSGSLVLAPTVNNLNVRFDAAGSGGDTWDFKNLKVRLALVDATKPTIRNNNDIRVADGAYGYGNTVYITIPFTEIVTVTGNPTLSTTWGTLNYIAGSGTNVLTFSGNIQADLGTVLTVNSIGGTSFTIKDLMGNAYNNTSISKTFSGLQVTNPWTGSGTANDPYIIMDRYQLDLLSRLVWSGQLFANTYFKLGADISYTHSSSDTWDKTSSFTSNFTSIGGWGHSFRGVFDGDGHSISGIRIYTSGTTDNDQCQGLFGYASSATVKNLVLYDANIVGYKQVGAIAGSQTYGTFQDCYIYNTRVAATSGTQQEVIAGSISGGNRDRIYFKNCKIGSNAGQHNIVKLTLTNDATVTRTPVTTVNSTLTTYSDGATISGEEYYSPDATITLGYSSSVSSGSFVKYTASTSSGDITYTNIDGNVLTMPDADVTVSAAILPVVDYLDADGNAQQCSDYTLITSSNSNVEMGASGKTHWYVVSSDATINAMLKFTDATANLILCNGATLNVNRTNSGSAVFANNLNIFGQTNGNGTLNATVSNGSGISSNALGIYGGIVSASGGDYGINAGGNSITLGYTAAANRVTASSYLCNSLTVKAGQTLTDGEGHLYNGTYSGDDLYAALTAMATKTLQPAYSITLPANFTVTGTTAAQGYAPANEVVTIHTAEGYTITSASYTPAGGSATTITPVEGVWSFTMPTANTTVSATRVINTYTVHFDANATNGIDVTGTMEDMDFTYGQAQNLTTNDFERTGYNFDGWNTAADGSGDAYTDGQNVNNLTNVLNGVVTLYAQWSIIPWQGNGTSENNPYIIIYASQLVKLSEDVNGGNGYSNKFFKLGNDINMSGVAFDGIGSSSARSFHGTFNGDGKTVSNVIVNKSEQNYVGFFGYVYYGTVRNLILDGVSISGYQYVGALVGYGGYNCSIENCLVMNSSVTYTNRNYIGVICGSPNEVSLTGNHYRNCTCNNTQTTNIGVGAFTNSNDVDGARSIHTLALPEHVTATSADMLTYDNVTYYASNVEVALTPASGITLADVTVNGVAATHQQDETWTFTMPAADATVTASASVPYIDADGNLAFCTSFTVIESSEGDVTFPYNDNVWYVVSGNVNINGRLFLSGGNCHLILCDGATLNINNTNNNDGLICNNLIIYGQSVGNGTLTASAPWNGISTNNGLTINGGIISATSTTSTGLIAGDLTINRGSITAHGHYDGMSGENIIINGGIVNATNGEGSDSYGINAEQDITLGYTELTDRITASSYNSYNGTLSVKANQALYDGTAVAYSGTLTNTQINAIAGKTLEPCFILTLPAHVNATGVISQDGTTAYALAGNEITIAAVAGYEITSGTTSFTMPAQDVVSDVTVQIITYNITYDLAGGTVATANPTTYTVETPTFTLVNPTREYFTFAGWEGAGLSEPTTTVTIEQGSTGDRKYYANWTPNFSEFWDGDGSQEHPYIITDTIGLNMLATLVNEGYDLGDGKRYFELGADIQYDNTVDNNYKSVGNAEGGDHAFSDIFDGKGHTISGIRVSSSRIVQGVFGWSFGGTVKNVILTDAIFSVSGYYAGGLVGYNQGTVENCLVIDVTVSGEESQGAVVGVNEGGTVTNSYYRNCTVGNSSGQTNCYTVSGGTDVNVVFNSYAYGILYNGTLYAPEGTDVSLNLTYTGDVPQGYAPIFLSDNAYYPLNGTSNPYLLRTTNEDITINVELGLADVAYLDANGVQQTCPVARRITSDNSEEYVLYNGQWFVVDDNVTINEGIHFEDDAHLIIKDGATLTTQEIGGRYSLSIYAQSGGDDMGCINAMVYAEGLIINGGIINANQVDGSGLHSNRGDLVITSGRITANIIEADYEEHKGIANIILSWRNTTDFITASSYLCQSGNVKVKAGQIFTDGTNYYVGTLTNDQVTALAGQTLVPYQISWAGNGTEEHPYIITTPAELDWFSTMVNAGTPYENTYFELGNDITYEYTSDWDDTSSEENNFTAIGSLNYCAFLGVFDGKGHAISGIRIYSNEGKQGLFGVTFNAVIRNITLTDTRITTVNEANVGGIVGVNQGTVENCHVTNTVNIHNVPVQVGGIVGLNTTDAIVRGCTSSVRLTIDNENYHGSYGGIVGSLGSGCTIEDCLAIDVINECTNSSGPIVGSDNGTVNNSYYYNCTVGSESNMSNAYIVSHADNVTVAVNSYNLGIEYDGTLYAPENAVLSLNLGFTGDPQEFGGYMASAGTLTGTENPYSLTMPAEDVHISAKMSIPYIDADGQTAYCQNYTILNGSTDYSSYGEDGVEACYVVDHDVTYSDGLYFNGPTNLILVDGATLTINDETEGNGYMSCIDRLTIYVQSEGTGAITAVNSGIYVYGDLIIHGGHITLSNDNSQAYMYSDGDMTINGGAISIENSNHSCIYTYGLLTVNDGTLNAVVTEEDNGYDVIYSEEDVVINGGNITVTNQGYGRGIVGDNVTINGGCVKVYIVEDYGYSGIGVDWWEGKVITLGWTDPSDLIMSEGGYDTYQLSIAPGQAFTDGEGNYFLGTYYNWDEIAALAGKTLRPFTNLDETFHITYVTNGGTLPDGYPTTYTFDETVELPVPTKEDNAFAGWFDNAEFNGDPVTEIVAGTTLGDKTFYAKWMPAKTWVEYLDADGQQQRVYATVLYGIETELPGGVYTIVDDDVYFDKLTFTDNTTIILPDYKRLYVEAWGKGTNDDENGLFVNGDLTIYGQEFGDGLLNSFNVQVSEDVAIYGGHLDIGILSANNGSGTITLSWTGLGNQIRTGYQGNVVLAKAFMDDDYTIYEAGTVADVTTINGQWLYPYITETEVSYIDENGDTHTENATVLFGDETSLSGGTYTIINYTSFSQAVSFSGDTKLIIPDGIEVYGYYQGGGINLNVTGDLAIYGQENRSGTVLYINASVSGAVTVSNVRVIYSFINSESDILIAGGEQNYGQLSTNGIITLGYLTFNDQIFCYDYEGTVAIREGLTMINDENGKTYTGTLTAEEVAEIENNYLYPYLTPINLEVAGYGESTESDHWVFIASPIAGSIYADNVTHLIGGMTPSGQYDYDLYRFNQSADKEWENYQQHNTMSDPFLLENGKGYLYANKKDVTLKFGGAVYPAATKEVALDYDANADFAGWNLVGNPFNAPATLDKSYYKMNSEGTGLVAEAVSGNTTIDAFTGVMVQAENENDIITFVKSVQKSTLPGGPQGGFEIALTQAGTRGTALLDNAIVSFNEGDQLGKFYFGTQNANIYIPVGYEEYAIAYAGNQTEMPLNFTANENGEYTLTVSYRAVTPNGVSYLHLVDNLTGADIDLLAPPCPPQKGGSYTFEARTSDYASRFKLVFSANGIEGNDDFAFIDADGNIVINGTGIVQVIDLLGHVLYTRDVHSDFCLLSSDFLSSGVYVLRLINGDDVKTQKIVIK